MTQINVFKKTKKQQGLKTPYLALDVEDDSSGNALIISLYGDIKVKTTDDKQMIKHYEKTVLGEKEIKEFVEKELNTWDKQKCIVVCYNTDYDTGGLDYLGLKMERLYSKSKFISGKNPKGMKFVDLARQFPEGFSLEQIMPYVGMKKDKQTQNEDNERKAGIINDAWIKRCKNDAKATYLITKKIQKFYEHLGVQMKLTIASTALKVYQTNFFPENHVWIRKKTKQFLNDFERKGYRGGRVEGFSRNECNVLSYDVNSMYVSVMAENKFPDPNSAVWVNPALKQPFLEHLQNLEGKEGIAHCLVHVPKTMKYPPLPYKNKKAEKDKHKLIFPVGYLEGHWTFAELRLALEVGCAIEKVFKYVYYKKTFPYFKTFGEWVWNERKKHPKDKDPFLNLMVKLIGNSVYGKFGQKNEIGSELIKLEDFPEWFEKPGNKERYKTARHEKTEGWIKMPAIAKRDAIQTFPCIATYITSFARIKLYKEMIRHDTVYVDTDSIKFVADPLVTKTLKKLKLGTKNKELDHSSELGEWGFEYTADFQFYAPKFYDLTNRFDGKGHRLKDVNICRGLPKRAKIVEDNDKYRKGVFEAPNKFKESIQTGKEVNRWETREKILVKEDFKRVWLENGNSKPLEVDDRK